jgi:hypothetical protein
VTGSGGALTIEFFYEKQVRELFRAAYDVTDGEPGVQLGAAQSLGNFRVGEAVSVSGLTLLGMELVSDASKLALVDGAQSAQTVEFRYRSTAEDEVTVEAIDDSSEAILQTYTARTGVKGAVTVNAPVLAGWKLKAGESGAGNHHVPIRKRHGAHLGGAAGRGRKRAVCSRRAEPS